MCQILNEHTLECLLFECDIENIIIIFRRNLKAVYFYPSTAAIATCCQLPHSSKLKLGNDKCAQTASNTYVAARKPPQNEKEKRKKHRMRETVTQIKKCILPEYK